MTDMNEKIKSCLQDESPFCTYACPFHLDIKDIIKRIRRGSFDSAYKAYRNKVGFPYIVSQICDHPCESACPRSNIDDAVQMQLLERAVCEYTKNNKPTDYNIPVKNHSIAIVGGGITGLACALRLAEKKYSVTLFEKSDRLGGTLHEMMDSADIQTEIDTQFMYIDYTVKLNHEIKDLSELNDFDAVYIATGKDGSDFGLQANPAKGHFVGGSILGLSKMEALSMGLDAVNKVEWWLKTQNMPPEDTHEFCEMQVEDEIFTLTPAVKPANGATFSKEEAVEESKRCAECACDNCRRHCDLIDILKKQPKRMKDEVDNSVDPKQIDGGGYTYKRMMAACSDCGQCKDHCPEHIDFGTFILEGRAKIQAKGEMPPAFYGYWLNDCSHAQSARAALTSLPKGETKVEYAFFPGCQLGASDPQYVTKAYDFLLSVNPATALMVNCCGVPQHWAGMTDLHQATLKKITEQWESLGKPQLIFACPTCYEQFKRFMPDIKGIMIYEMPELKALAADRKLTDKQTISVFDPCATRKNPNLQQAVRDLVAEMNYENEPLKTDGSNAMCCSWGGHGSIANPDFAKQVIERRTEQNENTYVAYCVNCRDIFTQSGKPTYHIFDLIFGINDENRQPPLLTERRHNREQLKAELLQKLGKTKEEDTMTVSNKYNLQISNELKAKMSQEYILEEDIIKVVNHCEDTKEKLLSKTSNHYFGRLRIDYATYWVEYEPTDNSLNLINVYSHRMLIDGE